MATEEAQEHTREKKKLDDIIADLNAQITALTADSGDALRQLQEKLRQMTEEHAMEVDEMLKGFSTEKNVMNTNFDEQLQGVKVIHS